MQSASKDVSKLVAFPGGGGGRESEFGSYYNNLLSRPSALPLYAHKVKVESGPLVSL